MAASGDSRFQVFRFFFTVIGWAGTIYGLVSGQYITVLQGFLALIAVTYLAALMSKQGETRFFAAAVGVALPCAGIALLVVREGNGNADEMRGVMRNVGVLLVALLGFYVLFRGWRK